MRACAQCACKSAGVSYMLNVGIPCTSTAGPRPLSLGAASASPA